MEGPDCCVCHLGQLPPRRACSGCCSYDALSLLPGDGGAITDRFYFCGASLDNRRPDSSVLILRRVSGCLTQGHLRGRAVALGAQYKYLYVLGASHTLGYYCSSTSTRKLKTEQLTKQKND